jgi:hypothetical protein
MSVRRWLILVALVSVSLVISLAPLIWYLVASGSAPRTGPRFGNFLQLLEVVIAYGLIVRRADWACGFGIIWYLVKAIYAGGVGIGMGISGGWSAGPFILFVLAGSWGYLSFFLWWNNDDFN